MFGSLGVPELLFILVLALLIFGPKRLPEIGRTLGKGLAEFRRASSELKRTIETELQEEDLGAGRLQARLPGRVEPAPPPSSPLAAAMSRGAPETAAAPPAAEPPAAAAPPTTPE